MQETPRTYEPREASTSSSAESKQMTEEGAAKAAPIDKTRNNHSNIIIMQKKCTSHFKKVFL